MNGNEPKFSWSPFREGMFQRCQLCYVLHYYTAHKGWLNSSSTEAKAAYRWKQANKIKDLMFNTLVNTLIDDIYSDEKMSLSQTKKGILDTLNESFIDSVKHKATWYHKPKSVNMLYELVYEDELDEGFVEETTSTLTKYLRNFLHSQFVKDLSTKGTQLLDVKNKFRGGFSYIDIPVHNVRAYAGVQTVHMRDDKKVIATIFKTDSNPSTLSQIGVVAQIVSNTLNVPMRDIIVRDEFLCDATFEEYNITEVLLSAIKTAISQSIEDMSKLLVNEDIQRNEFVGFEDAKYHRSIEHQKAGDDMCTMDSCPYCEAVKRDLELYPSGYDPKINILKYSKKVLGSTT